MSLQQSGEMELNEKTEDDETTEDVEDDDWLIREIMSCGKFVCTSYPHISAKFCRFMLVFH